MYSTSSQLLEILRRHRESHPEAGEVAEPKDMYSLTVKFDRQLIPAAKASIRAVGNVDLAATGGYALVGDFVSNYSGGGILTATSSLPMVFMLTVDMGSSSKRFAVVAVPRTPRFGPTIIQKVDAHSDEFGLKASVSVNGDALILGAYVEGNRQLAVPGLDLGENSSKNVYYQVATDLHHLYLGAYINFKKMPDEVLSYQKSGTVHKNLPVLPDGFRWGPEVGGIMTIQRITDPYTLLLPYDILQAVDDMPKRQKEALLRFIDEQSNLLDAASKTYKQIAKVFK